MGRPRTRTDPSHAALGAALGATLLVALVAFAFRDLVDYDPTARLRRHVEGAEAWFFSPLASSPWFVIACALAVLYHRRAHLVRSAGSPVHPLGAALLLGLPPALAFWSHYVGAPGLLVPSLCAFVLAAGYLLAGRPGLHAVALPGALLLLCAPLPPIVVHALVFPLQGTTARLVAELAGALGRPATASGDLVQVGAAAFHVIETCSGLRSMLILTVTAIAAVGFSQRSRAAGLLLILAAPLLAFAANLARVLVVVLDPDSPFAESHVAQGVAAFATAALALVGLDLGLRHAFPGPGRARTPSAPPEPRRPVSPARVAALAATLALVATRGLLPVWTPDGPPRPTLHDMPSTLEGWSSRGLDVDRAFLGSVAFSERSYRRFRREDTFVDLFVGVDDRLRPEVSFLSQKTALLGRGRTLVRRDRESLEPEAGPAELLTVRSPAGRDWLVLTWTEGVRSPWMELARSLLALDRGPLRRPGWATVVRISTPVADSRAQAIETLRAFLPNARAALSRPG